MRKTSLSISAALLAVSACATAGGAPKVTPASAELRDAQGNARGEAKVSQVADGVRIMLKASGLPAGTYGTHLHTVGRCEAPDFASAGPHWNPNKKEHGRDNPQGMHEGDLPNLTIAANGKGKLDIVIKGVSLRDGEQALLDPNGAAIIIHSAADDYRTDPSGNSGARVACGVFG